MTGFLHHVPGGDLQLGDEDPLLTLDLLDDVRFCLAPLLDVREVGVDVGDPRGDGVELGEDVLGECSEEVLDLSYVTHSSNVGIELVSGY